MMGVRSSEGTREGRLVQGVDVEDGEQSVRAKKSHPPKSEIARRKQEREEEEGEGTNRKSMEMQELLDDIARYQELADALQRQLVEAGRKLVEGEQELNAANMRCERLEEEIESLQRGKAEGKERILIHGEDEELGRSLDGLLRRMQAMEEEIAELRRRNVDLEMQTGQQEELRDALEQAEMANGEYREQLVKFGRINRSMTERHEKELKRMRGEREDREKELRELRNFRARWEEEKKEMSKLKRAQAQEGYKSVQCAPFTCEACWREEEEEEEEGRKGEVKEQGNRDASSENVLNDGEVKSRSPETGDASEDGAMLNAALTGEEAEEKVLAEKSKVERTVVMLGCDSWKFAEDMSRTLKEMNSLFDQHLSDHRVLSCCGQEEDLGRGGGNDAFKLLRDLVEKFFSFIITCCADNEECIVELIGVHAVVLQVRDNLDQFASLTAEVFEGVYELIRDVDSHAACLRDRSVRRLVELREKVAAVLSQQTSQLDELTRNISDLTGKQKDVIGLLEEAVASCGGGEEKGAGEDETMAMLDMLKSVDEDVRELRKMLAAKTQSSSRLRDDKGVKTQKCLQICDRVIETLSGGGGRGGEVKLGDEEGEAEQGEKGGEANWRGQGEDRKGEEESDDESGEEEEEVHRTVFSYRKGQAGEDTALIQATGLRGMGGEKATAGEEEAGEGGDKEEEEEVVETEEEKRGSRSMVEELLGRRDQLDFDAMLEVNETLKAFLERRRQRGSRMETDLSALLSPPPPPADPSGDKGEEEAQTGKQDQDKDQSGPSPALAPSPAPAPPPPPPAWIQRMSRRWQRPFFVHVPSRRTQWKYPGEAELRRGQLEEELRAVEVQLEVKSLTGLWVSWENVRRVLEDATWRQKAAVRMVLLAVGEMKRKEIESSWV